MSYPLEDQQFRDELMLELDKTKKELDKTKKELDKTKKELDKTKKELDKTKKELYNDYAEKLKVLDYMPWNMAYIFEKYGNNPEDCRFIYVSKASNTIYNLTPSAICSDPMSVISLISPEDTESFISSVNTSYSSIDIWEWTGKVTINNVVKYLQCKSYPEIVNISKDGIKTIRWYGSVTDISEIYNSHNEYRQLLTTSINPIMGFDTQLNINEWNEEIEKLTGYTKSIVIGTSIMELVLPDDIKKTEETLKSAINNVKVSNYRLRLNTSTNNIIELQINSSVRNSIDGMIIGVIITGIDLTQLKQEILNKNKADIELELHQKVVASVFHEVRNPLNVTFQIFELLKTKLMEIKAFDPCVDMDSSSLELSNQNISKYNEYVITNCSEMFNDVEIGIQCSEQKLKVLNDILSMTQLEQNKLVLKTEDIELYQLCNDQINMISKTAKVGVQTKITCPDIHILGDDKHLSQILTNLLSNSVKIVENGSISLDVIKLKETETDYYLDFKIIDSGCGITQTKIEQLLEAKQFQHGGFKHGSGIGLCIVIEILKLMNSKLEITSPYNNGTINNGSCFSFKYKCPKALTYMKKTQTDERILELEPIENVRILIVDDSKFNHIVLTKQFRVKLATLFINTPIVSSAYSGEECLEYLKTNEVDIIIMDQIMDNNQLLGTETIKLIRRMGLDTIIIHSSGNCTKDDNKIYYECGSNYVWEKPVPIKNIELNIYNLMKDPKYYINKLSLGK